MTNWRDTGDVTLDVYEAEFRRLDSPLLGEVEAVHLAAEGLSALGLAMMFHEQKYATLSDIPAEFRNPLSLAKPDGTPADGLDRWMRFDTWAEGVAAWKERITSPTYKDGIYARTTTIEELVHVYAPSSDGNSEARYVAVLNERLDAFSRFPRKEPAQMARPSILIVAGHRTVNDHGAPGEEAQVVRIAPVLASTLRQAGYDVTLFPPDPNQEAPGDLDTAGLFAHDWAAGTPGSKVMIDVHLEDSPARGVFAIVPNGAGLVTGAPFAQVAHDTWDNNEGERRLGKALVEEIHARTGISIRTAGVREPGLMDEGETFVGQGCSGTCAPSRLAMFAYTSPFVDTCYRLVVEHGNVNLDADVITRGDYPTNVAQAAVAALAREFGTVQVSEEFPQTNGFVKPSVPAFLAKAQEEHTERPPMARIGRVPVILVSQQFRAAKETPVLRSASRTSKPVRAALQAGDTFDIAYVFSSNGEPWGLSRFGSRIPLRDAKPVPH